LVPPEFDITAARPTREVHNPGAEPFGSASITAKKDAPSKADTLGGKTSASFSPSNNSIGNPSPCV
jgi:hypothetical protein